MKYLFLFTLACAALFADTSFYFPVENDADHVAEVIIPKGWEATLDEDEIMFIKGNDECYLTTAFIKKDTDVEEQVMVWEQYVPRFVKELTAPLLDVGFIESKDEIKNGFKNFRPIHRSFTYRNLKEKSKLAQTFHYVETDDYVCVYTLGVIGNTKSLDKLSQLISDKLKIVPKNKSK